MAMRAGDITIGRDLGPVGRWARAALGLLELSYGAGGLVAGDVAVLPTVGLVVSAGHGNRWRHDRRR